MERRKNLIRAGIALCLLLLLCFGANTAQNNKNVIFDGAYEKTGADGEIEKDIQIWLDAGTMTYETKMQSTEDAEPKIIDSGSFSTENGFLYTFSETDDENSLVYECEGNVLKQVKK